jgi:hypothetical protein
MNEELILSTLHQLCENDAGNTGVLAGFAALLSTRFPTLTSAEQSQFQATALFLQNAEKTQRAHAAKVKAALQSYQAAKGKIHDN